MIAFGKYKNKAFEFVLKTDINYCKNILHQEDKIYCEFKKYIQENLPIIYDTNKLKYMNCIKCSKLMSFRNMITNLLI